MTNLPAGRAVRTFLLWATATGTVLAQPVSDVPAAAADTAAAASSQAGLATAAKWRIPPEPEYPLFARQLYQHGQIVVRLVVDATGTPVHSEILRREPPHVDFFDDAVQLALMKARATVPADAVPGRFYAYQATINFTMDGGGNQHPWVRIRQPVEMPAEALSRGVSGWVSVLLPVDAEGRPDIDRARVLSRQPLRAIYFDPKALEALKGYRFAPLLSAGTPAPRWTVVRIDFRTPDQLAAATAPAP
ncbi:energy transducer TonB [Xylophilus sp. GOD-11R]|uniref:energy transducer TonB n=1 Tax=Xylophilus sp. GOD-11R TaxID=3089814 RepID=UPI00298C139B|nr:energy transducer TonB [Xylophilus sp. GOD-11R]WPB58541.1 energy transducer TonB [Xylophilus sp. GOD-11R]